MAYMLLTSTLHPAPSPDGGRGYEMEALISKLNTLARNGQSARNFRQVWINNFIFTGEDYYYRLPNLSRIILPLGDSPKVNSSSGKNRDFHLPRGVEPF
jgi:hypothetical protein